MLDPAIVSAQVSQLKADIAALLDATISSRASASALTTVSDAVTQYAAPMKNPMMVYYIKSSATWTVPATGLYRIYVFGAGGSGAKCSTNKCATGGQAGGFSIKDVRLTSGTSLTLTVGLGGAGQATNDTAGNAGGASSVSGGGLSITANGGAAGQTGATSASGATSGGTATGGDINITGGGSGAASATSTGFATTGGGAVGVFGTGYASAAASSTSATSVYGNGAGVGGLGSFSSASDFAGALGSKPAVIVTGTGSTLGAIDGTPLFFFPFPVFGGSGYQGTNYRFSPGGGGGGLGGSSDGTTYQNQSGGFCAGAGSGWYASGLAGGFAGGGGGAGKAVTSGAGGDGCIVIVFEGA